MRKKLQGEEVEDEGTAKEPEDKEHQQQQEGYQATREGEYMYLAEDNIPYYDEVVKDIGQLEKANGVLDHRDDLRNRIVTFIAENYTPREAGRTICKACLSKTPNNLSICIRCHGSLISWGEKSATQDDSTAPGMPERERQESNDGTEEVDGDVEMEKDEIDRLIRETKRMAEEKTDDDVDMSGSRTSQPSSGLGSRGTRSTPDPQAVFGGKTKEQQEEEDEPIAQEQEQDEEQRESQIKLPLWTARTVQGSIIHCIDIAQNEDAIDSTARAIDTMILSYLEDRYRLYHAWTAMASAQTDRLLPEFDGYTPYFGENAGGDIREPNEAEFKAAFQEHAKDGKIGGRDLEVYLKGVNGIRTLCKIMKYLVLTGVTPQLINTKVIDAVGVDDERKIEVRHEATDFVHKIIAETFAARSYDYFRVDPPRRDDHVYLDPVELAN